MNRYKRALLALLIAALLTGAFIAGSHRKPLIVGRTDAHCTPYFAGFPGERCTERKG